MAGGPIGPYSIVPDSSGEIFPSIVSNTGLDAGMGCANATDLTADRTLHLRFEIPPTLPSGTSKLRALAIGNATTGVAKFNPKWASVAAEEAPGTLTRTAEGTQTVTWAAGDANVIKETKVVLDADTVVAGEVIAMDLVFENTGFTLAVVSTWVFSILWE